MRPPLLGNWAVAIRPVLMSSILVGLSLVSACGGGSDDEGSSNQPLMCIGANVTANETNNYTFSSTMKMSPITVKAKANLTFDWSAVSKDFLGHAVNPRTDLKTIMLLMFQLPLSEVEQKLNDDTLAQNDIFVSPPPSLDNATAQATSVQLFSMKLNGIEVPSADYEKYLDPAQYPASQYSYMIAASGSTELGKDFRMLQTFQPDPGSSNTTVALTNDSTKLTYNAKLTSLTMTGVPGGTRDLKLDWSKMKTNAMGATFEEGFITSVIVGHYDETPRQLEQKFLDLNLIAKEYYTAEIPTGSVLDFTMLKDKSGNATFNGITDDGTWLVGLVCGNCKNPAPWYLTILKPCSAM